MESNWYEIPEEVHAFAEALWNGGYFDRVRDLFYMLGKPWKWTDERNAWVAAGRPEEWS